jgi:hydroxymethylglutaryl-CoA reductase (NADPH)
MPTAASTSVRFFQRLLDGGLTLEDLEARLAPRTDDVPPAFPAGARVSDEILEKRWRRVRERAPDAEAVLRDAWTRERTERYGGNIENFVGTVKLPVGVAGPLRVNGLFARGDYLVPLATTEAALVASYHRGARLLSAAGGCSAALLNESVNRTPAFAFRNLAEAGRFVHWVLSRLERFQGLVEASSRYAKLVDVGFMGEGNHVYLNFQFHTGDAAGQNMVTIATQRIFDDILEHAPVRPAEAYVEGNLSGDKKASAQAFNTVRGKKVSAEAVLTPELVHKFLHVTPRAMADYWKMSAVGGILSGTLGIQGHYANGLAALFIATGQDAACVAESATGVTRFEVNEDGALYAAVTLPNLVVGTVGGGTGLPTQRACLEILGLAGPGRAGAFAEVCGALLLAGELSIIGAMAAGHFTRAHQKLARTGKPEGAG